MLIAHLASVVVRDLDVEGISVFESKTNAPLVIDRDGVPAFPVPGKLVETVSRGHP
jgi:hypothetical protein